MTPGRAASRRVDVRAILADEEQRRALMVGAIRALQAREGIDTSEEQALRAYERARPCLRITRELY